MLSSLLAQASDAAQALDFDRPPIDWHAIAPELVLLGVVIVLVIIDVVYTERGRVFTGAVAGRGLLAVMIGYTFSHLLVELPLTFDLTAWYGFVTLMTLVIPVGIAVWGFRIALAGRPLFRDEIPEAEKNAR